MAPASTQAAGVDDAGHHHDLASSADQRADEVETRTER
jgi:hypothetical protein